MSGLRVLVAEPRREIYRIIEKLLHSRDAIIKYLTSGYEAFKVLEHEEFDVICIGTDLGDMSGAEFASEFGMRYPQKNIPIFMITRENEEVNHVNAMQSGITDVFTLNKLSDLDTYLNRLGDLNQNELNSATIVLIEDNITLAKVIKKNLEILGCKVVHFNLAEDAYNYISQNDCDVILTDLVLPGKMTGLNLIRNVKRLNKNIPIIVITAYDDETRKLETLKEGVSDYLLKPFSKDEMLIRLQNTIKNRKDLQNLIQLKNKLEEFVYKDSLTGLFNRHFLEEFGKKKIKEAKRQGFPISLILIDLDHFKKINDNYGHLIGDKILVEVSNALKRYIREEDIIIRYGGEEFLILLSYCNECSAIKKAEFLRELIENLKPNDIKITASFGISSFDPKENECDIKFEELFKMADVALYSAKQSGRNMVKSYKSLNPALLDSI